MPFGQNGHLKFRKFQKLAKFEMRRRGIKICDETYFSKLIFIEAFKYDIKIDIFFSIKPVGAHSFIFDTFARTPPITRKLYQNIESFILEKKS